MGKQLEWKQVPTWVAVAEDGPYSIVLMVTENAPGQSCTISQTHLAGDEQTRHEQHQADNLEQAKQLGLIMFEAWGADREQAVWRRKLRDLPRRCSEHVQSIADPNICAKCGVICAWGSRGFAPVLSPRSVQA